MALVRLSHDGDVAVLTLDRPPVNALSAELVSDLDDAIGEVRSSSARAVVVTGAPHFAAGADIAGFQQLMDAGGTGAELGEELSNTLSRLSGLALPVIAAVRGYALGGGLELAMACDLRILGEGAKVGQPEIKLGVVPGAGGTQRLPRLVGAGRARDLIFTGRMVDAAEALSIGIADRVVPDDALDDAAMAWARELAAGPTAAIAIAKALIADAFDLSLREGLGRESAGFQRAFTTADAAEGVAAFLEKRPPEFTGR